MNTMQPNAQATVVCARCGRELPDTGDPDNKGYGVDVTTGEAICIPCIKGRLFRRVNAH